MEKGVKVSGGLEHRAENLTFMLTHEHEREVIPTLDVRTPLVLYRATFVFAEG